MAERISPAFSNALKKMLDQLEKQENGKSTPLELRQYFGVSKRVANRLLSNQHDTASTRRLVRKYSDLTSGILAATRLLENTGVFASEDGNGTVNPPNQSYLLCMAGCIAAFNECMGRDSDGQGSDEDDDNQFGSLDDTDDGEEDGGLLGPELACKVAYTTCLAGCQGAMS